MPSETHHGPGEGPTHRQGQWEPVVQDIVGGGNEHEERRDETIGCAPRVRGVTDALFESGGSDALHERDREEAGRSDMNGEVDPRGHGYPHAVFATPNVWDHGAAANYMSTSEHPESTASVHPLVRSHVHVVVSRRRPNTFYVLQDQTACPVSTTGASKTRVVDWDSLDGQQRSLIWICRKERRSRFGVQIEIAGDDIAFRTIVCVAFHTNCLGERETIRRASSLDEAQ